ncbi:response regulator transcription factor [Tenacibaculum xiamenense]|uniref:response regulator transcription factor n=1 Tax=Tenacibaculum xiamenense TaxID=1261553 RepID=UPI0038955086
MPNVNDFFTNKNTVKNISENQLSQLSDFLIPIEAFARTTNSSIYVIDYNKKGFDYVSSNPLFLCGHSPSEVIEMGYEFYFKYVTQKDIELLLKINQVGFDFYEKIPLIERTDYTISYDFHLKNKENKTILVNQKLTPLFLADDGKIWKAMCVISISSSKKSGNIKIVKKNSNIVFKYQEIGNYWSSYESIQLTERDKEILFYSSRGFTINDIAKEIFISANTVKFHRKKLFEKLNVSNISEAIVFATNNGLLQP